MASCSQTKGGARNRAWGCLNVHRPVNGVLDRSVWGLGLTDDSFHSFFSVIAAYQIVVASCDTKEPANATRAR
jgi:hypothetical protein